MLQLIFGGSSRPPEANRRSQMQEDFAAFLKRREEISNDYINGQGAALDAISANADPASFMPPSGALVVGADAVRATNAEAASSFRTGSTGHFEIVQSGSSGTLGFWTGLQHANAMMKGKDEPIPMILRVTELFRYDEDGWKLVHRHADFLKKADAKKT